jgi:tetratricopeptide (TPR) repeat protein
VAYEEVQAIAPNLPLLDVNYGNALQAAGRMSDAENAYRCALARQPLDVMAHRGLNLLLWRLNRPDFLASYDAAIASHPDNSGLFTEKGRLQLLYSQNEESFATFEQALKVAPQDERAREGRASALSRLGRHDEAVKEFESIAARWPESAEIRAGLSECFLRSGDSQNALAAAEQALSSAPHNQLALALRSTALRQLNDMDGAEDYESLVEIFDLMAPEGYSDLGAFHRELSAYLNRLLGDVPAKDATGGRLVSRTGGTLFGAGEPVIAALRSHVDKAVAAYVARLPADEAHPFLARRNKELRYWGSWSTRVASHGSIPNHIHDKGWISAVYFVNAPDDVNDARDAKGWLKFGEPPFDAHLRKPVIRRVKPLPGRLVLFPSFFWHGSIQSDAPSPRLTVSFDAVPEASRV